MSRVFPRNQIVHYGALQGRSKAATNRPLVGCNSDCKHRTAVSKGLTSCTGAGAMVP